VVPLHFHHHVEPHGIQERSLNTEHPVYSCHIPPLSHTPEHPVYPLYLSAEKVQVLRSNNLPIDIFGLYREVIRHGGFADNERYDDYNRWIGGINFGGKVASCPRPLTFTHMFHGASGLSDIQPHILASSIALLKTISMQSRQCCSRLFDRNRKKGIGYPTRQLDRLRPI